MVRAVHNNYPSLVSPFSIQVHVGTTEPLRFHSWLEEAFRRVLAKGAPIARAVSSQGSGHLITNGEMFLKSHASLAEGDVLNDGDYVASGVADGDQIPYGKPYCVFVLHKW